MELNNKKLVVVKVEFNTVFEVPQDWDKDDVEFWLNESSSCKDNIVSRMHSLGDRDDWCWCPFGEAEFIREATEQDKKDYKL